MTLISLTHCGLVMVTKIWINIGSGNDFLPDSIEPLPEPLLTYHNWGFLAFTWGQFHRKCSRYLSLIWLRKLLIWDQTATSHRANELNELCVDHHRNKQHIFTWKCLQNSPWIPPSKQECLYPVSGNAKYSALSTYHGHFSSYNSWKTLHSSPVRVGYGVFLVSANLNKIYHRNCCDGCTIVSYITVIYRESVVCEIEVYLQKSNLISWYCFLQMLCFIWNWFNTIMI